MKTLNYVKLILILMITAGGATSCGDDYYTDDFLRNSDAKLCSKTWIEEYETDDNELCKHILKFSAGGSGKETYEYYPQDGRKPYDKSYRFDWSWMDNSMEGLRLDYGADDVIYFENLWVREHYLSGKFRGDVVVFTDANYSK